MKLLLVSDEESPYFWDYYRPGRLDGIDLILAAGDLKADYLSFLVTMGRAPVLYIHGRSITAVPISIRKNRCASAFASSGGSSAGQKALTSFLPTPLPEDLATWTIPSTAVFPFSWN